MANGVIANSDMQFLQQHWVFMHPVAFIMTNICMKAIRMQIDIQDDMCKITALSNDDFMFFNMSAKSTQ